MKTTKRLTKAMTRLYNGFHKGKLYAGSCDSCAVGNMVGGKANWYFALRVYTKAFKNHSYDIFTPLGLEQIRETGYSINEIEKIENIFERTVRHNAFQHKQTKEGQFKGLEAVIKYLCELDGIDNVMDYTKVFDYNEKGAINKLAL